MRIRQIILIASATALVGPAVYSLTRPDPADQAKRSLTVVSNAYRLDRIYRSMEGPMSIASGIHLGPIDKSRVEWITGLETEVVDATGQEPISQEFFCHSNLTFAEHAVTPSEVNQRFGGKTHFDWRLFTLMPGRRAIELPPGFGVPVPADVPLDYLTMSLNLNPRTDAVNVRLRTKVHTIAAGEPGAPTQALFRRALYVLEPEDPSAAMGPKCMATSAMQHVGAGCAEFQPAAGLTNHWTVAPGRHVYETEITPQLNLPFDTTIHYATIHVHPFAREMELRDLTTGQTILQLHSRDWTDRIGVAHVGELKSAAGIPIFRNHRYELSAEYDNTSGAKTDAMAILYLYLLEKNLS
jgi:hypothetical protein